MTVTRIGVEPAEPATGCAGLGMHQVFQRIPGLTYRQLDFWTRTGRLKFHHHAQGSNGKAVIISGGSGTERCWPPNQVNLAARVYRLTLRGIGVETAFALAQNKGVLTEMLSELTKIEAELDD